MSFEELIPFLIAVVVLIVRAFSNSNKKKQTVPGPRREHFPDTEVGEMYGEEDERDPRKILLDMLGVEPEKESTSEADAQLVSIQEIPEDKEEDKLYSNYNLPSLEMADVTRMSSKLEAMRESGEDSFKEDPEPESSFWGEEPIDVRRAIIYSEIIRPKYTD